MAGTLIDVGPFYWSLPVIGGPRGNKALLLDAGYAGVQGFDGYGYIAGERSGDPLGIVQDKDGNPLSRPVLLLVSRTKFLLRRTISAADGTYRFEGLREGIEYTLILEDDRRQEESVIADRILPWPMP